MSSRQASYAGRLRREITRTTESVPNKGAKEPLVGRLTHSDDLSELGNRIGYGRHGVDREPGQHENRPTIGPCHSALGTVNANQSSYSGS